MTDRPIHLAEYSISKKETNGGYQVTIPVTLVQSHLDALLSLINFCNGFSSSGKGEVPGSFDLVMFHRLLHGTIHQANSKKLAKDKDEV